MTKKERNQQFERKTELIDRTMRQHYRLIRACRMSREDVRQNLAVRMLEALDAYNPKLCPNLDAYLMQRLKYEMLHMAAPSKRYGIRFAPRSRDFQVLSLAAKNMAGEALQVGRLDERIAVLWLWDEIAALPDGQRAAITKLLCGKRVPSSNKSLQAARRRLRAQMDGAGFSVLPGREEAAFCA